MLLATVTSASNRARAGSPTPRFQSSSRLVVVPAVVLRAGKPLRGLKKEQFKVYEDGKEQKISHFEEIKADASPAVVTGRKGAVQDSFSNTQVDRSTPKRLVIIALDLLNTEFEDSVYARQELIRFLSQNVDDSALISLVAIGQGGVKVVHDFTSEPEVLLAALKKVAQTANSSKLATSGAPSTSAVFERQVNTLRSFLENGRFPGAADLNWSGDRWDKWFRVRQTLDALNLIAQAYAGVPGRKSLIWATGGFPFQIDGSGDLQGAAPNDLLGYYEHTWRVMNDANIAIYPVDARGLAVDFVDASQNVGIRDQSGGYENVVAVLRNRIAANLNRISTLHSFAEMTGGRAFYNSNDVAGGFRKAAADSASYYLLSYYMDRGKANDRKGRWHELKVKVDARETEVRARSGFFSGEDTPTAAKSEIALALASPLDFTALPVTVRWLPESSTESARALSQQGTANARNVGFELSIPPNSIAIDESDGNRMSVEVVTSARSEHGKDVNGVVQKIDGKMKKESIKQIRSHGFVYRGSISLAPGSYSVRFVVRDNVGQRTGSVAAPLKVN